MHHLYTVEELRVIEKEALKDRPLGNLMQRAGREAARLALELLSVFPENACALVLAGPGNNGGDALEMAMVLAENGIDVSVWQIDNRKTPSEAFRLAQERAANSNIRQEDACAILDDINSLAARKWDLVVDGMFGIGLKKPLDGIARQLAEIANTARCPVIALDVPSGLDADTGSICGANGIAVMATDTITFLGNKPGLYTHRGRDYAGNIHQAWLGVDASRFPAPRRWLNQPGLFAHLLRKRLHDTHKGTYGRIAILGGAKGMGGALALAARAALYCGAGIVYAVFLEDPPPYSDIQPELMCRAAHDFDFSLPVSVVGPGLGTSSAAKNHVGTIIRQNRPLVLDADALNLVAPDTGLQQMLKNRSEPALLTPHPLEAARLLNTTPDAVQSDRISAANALARRFNAVVALKGSGTVIADCSGKTAINPTGGPALATAGTGDVLCGICGALLAQGWPTWEAALAGVWLHGTAADGLVRAGEGPIGLTAGELIPEIRRALNHLVREYGG